MPRVHPLAVLLIVVAGCGRPAAPTATGPKVDVETAAVGGVRFEVEYRPGSERFQTSWRADAAGVVRGDDTFEFRFGVPVVNGTAFPSAAAGDTIRWNLSGPLLLNGQPVAPHRYQARPLDAAPTELKWDILHPSDSPRDTLSADWSRVGRVLVTAHGDGVARVWDVDKGTIRTVIAPDAPTDGRKRWGLKAAVSPDGKTVATANVQAAAVVLWEADTGKHIATLNDPDGKVTDLRFASDRLLFEARGGTLYSRDLTGDRSKVTAWGTVHAEAPASFTTISNVLAVHDGRRVSLPLWDAPGAKPPPNAVYEVASEAGALALSPDGAVLALADAPGSLTLHDTRNGTVLKRLWWRGAARVSCLAFIADGKTLTVGGGDGIRFYDVESGRERGWVQTVGLRSLAVSGDGATLAAAAEFGPAVLVWPVSALQPR